MWLAGSLGKGQREALGDPVGRGGGWDVAASWHKDVRGLRCPREGGSRVLNVWGKGARKSKEIKIVSDKSHLFVPWQTEIISFYHNG